MRLAFCVALLFAACAATQARPNLPGTFGAGEALPPPVAPEPGGALAPVPAPTAPAASATAPRRSRGRGRLPRREGALRQRRAGGGARVAGRVRRPPRPAPVPSRGRSDAGAAGAVCAATRRRRSGLLEPLVATPPDPGTASSARYYLGIAEVRLGGHARGRELLLPFLPAAGAAGPGDEALVELRGALAEATAASGELTRGAGAVGRLRARRPGAREGVRARAGGRAGRRTWRPTRRRAPGARRRRRGWRAPCWARRRPRTCARRADRGGAAAIDGETAAARHAMGFDDAQAQAQGSGDAGRLGLAIALTGKFQPVGEAAMRAAMLAVGMPDQDRGGAGAVVGRGDAALRARHGRRARAREHAGWRSWRATNR